MIGPEDEQIHAIGSDPHWQESFYFNWADLEQRAFTLARIGFRFHQQRIDGLIVSIRDGEPELVYPAANLSHQGSWDDQDPERGMRSRGFTVTMEEPLRRWRLRLEGRNSMDVVFEAHTPPFDYHAEGRRLAATMTGEHFEQTGSATGWTNFKGRRFEISSLGQRDKSWGARDWSRVEGWNWISAQFGRDLSFNLMQSFEDGQCFDNGFFFQDGENHAIESLEIRYRWGEKSHRPSAARIHALDSRRCEHEIHAEALGSFPLLKSGVWLEESHARFRIETPGGPRVGQGVMEHVWRPGKVALLARLPYLIASSRKALRR
jgi:hypothetical protein